MFNSTLSLSRYDELYIYSFNWMTTLFEGNRFAHVLGCHEGNYLSVAHYIFQYQFIDQGVLILFLGFCCVGTIQLRVMWFVKDDVVRLSPCTALILLQCEERWGVCCSVLQCVAVCCSVLQCVAVCCSVLQCGTDQLLIQRVNTVLLGARNCQGGYIANASGKVNIYRTDIQNK